MSRNPFSAARPVLYLGLVGFDADERMRIESQLNLAPLGGVQWRITRFPEADAWLVNGARTQVTGPHEVCVAPGAAGSDPVRLHLVDVDRPIAFSQPYAAADFEARYAFEIDSVPSLMILLAKFSQLLRPRAMLLALADLLTMNATGVRRRSRVWHLVCDNRLVGVVDLQGDVGVLPEATLGDLARASWLPRPDSAGYVPDNFARKSLAGLLWGYARRTDRELLPEAYRHAPIHLKRVPLIAQRLFGDAHLFVLRELADSPRTFAELCESAAFTPEEIARALTSFYLVGCISRSAPASRTDKPASVWPWWMSQHPDSMPRVPDFTAPGAISATH